MLPVDATFPCAYELDRDAELPPGEGGHARYYYPGARHDGGHADALILVTPQSGDPWYGRFAGPPTRGRCAHGLFSCPDPSSLCIVVNGAGYIVHVENPTDWSPVPLHPVLEVRPEVEHDLLLMNDFVTLMAYGSSGEVWRVRPEAITDMLVLDRVAGDRVHIRGENYALGSVELVLDVATGQPDRGNG